MLSGLIPSDGSEESELRRRLLAGRYSEARMLFFLGKDVFRWMDQCAEWSARVEELLSMGLEPQSFARLLISHPPPAVKDKLARWGVTDPVAIFSRAVGLRATFAEAPPAEVLSDEFLRNYHRYADALYRCYLEAQPHPLITDANFRFDLYASGEYSQLLESQWGE